MDTADRKAAPSQCQFRRCGDPVFSAAAIPGTPDVQYHFWLLTANLNFRLS